MGDSDQLQRLAARTRELAEELDRARPDLLSVTELNRALRHILSTQAAILEALAGVPLTGSAAVSRPHIRVTPSPEKAPEKADRPDTSRTSSRGEKRPAPASPPGRIELDPSELLESPILDLEPVEDDEVREVRFPARKPMAPAVEEAPRPVEVAPSPSAPAVAEGGNGAAPKNGAGAAPAIEGPPPGSMAEAWLNESRVVPGHLARQFVSQFDNRDKDYDKGLDKLNRWISAGSAGTPFQWRGDHAYLNLHGSAATTARNYEDQLMTRMGFSRRLGRLQVPGLEGEIVIYERPS